MFSYMWICVAGESSMFSIMWICVVRVVHVWYYVDLCGESGPRLVLCGSVW